MTKPAFGRGCDPRYLEPSPFAADGGQNVGKTPGKILVGVLRDLGTPGKPDQSNPVKMRRLQRGTAERSQEMRRLFLPALALPDGREPVSRAHARVMVRKHATRI